MSAFKRYKSKRVKGLEPSTFSLGTPGPSVEDCWRVSNHAGICGKSCRRLHACCDSNLINCRHRLNAPATIDAYAPLEATRFCTPGMVGALGRSWRAFSGVGGEGSSGAASVQRPGHDTDPSGAGARVRGAVVPPARNAAAARLASPVPPEPTALDVRRPTSGAAPVAGGSPAGPGRGDPLPVPALRRLGEPPGDRRGRRGGCMQRAGDGDARASGGDGPPGTAPLPVIRGASSFISLSVYPLWSVGIRVVRRNPVKRKLSTNRADLSTICGVCPPSVRGASLFKRAYPGSTPKIHPYHRADTREVTQ